MSLEQLSDEYNGLLSLLIDIVPEAKDDYASADTIIDGPVPDEEFKKELIEMYDIIYPIIDDSASVEPEIMELRVQLKTIYKYIDTTGSYGDFKRRMYKSLPDAPIMVEILKNLGIVANKPNNRGKLATEFNDVLRYYWVLIQKDKQKEDNEDVVYKLFETRYNNKEQGSDILVDTLIKYWDELSKSS